MSFVPVRAENHQQRVARGDEGGRLLSATPASQQRVRLTVPVINRHGVVVALVGQAVAALQVHQREEELDAIAGRERDAPVAVDVVRVDAGEMGAAEVAAHSRQDSLAFPCRKCT